MIGAAQSCTDLCGDIHVVRRVDLNNNKHWVFHEALENLLEVITEIRLRITGTCLVDGDISGSDLGPGAVPAAAGDISAKKHHQLNE